jgi:hypothetical protein
MNKIEAASHISFMSTGTTVQLLLLQCIYIVLRACKHKPLNHILKSIMYTSTAAPYALLHSQWYDAITVATVEIWQRYGYFKEKTHVAHHCSLQMEVHRIQPLGRTQWFLSQIPVTCANHQTETGNDPQVAAQRCLFLKYEFLEGM